MNKKKKRTLYILVLFIFIITLVFGISYAIFSYYRNGAKINQFYTADILYNFHEIENFVLKDVFPENYDYGTTQDDNLVSFSLNGNIQSGTLEYTISVIKGEDIEDLERLPGDALLISIQSTDESDVFETIAFDSEELVEDYIASKSLSELDNNDSMVLATGTLPSVPTIEHESFFVRIWVNDQKVMISDTICRNETTSKDNLIQAYNHLISISKNARTGYEIMKAIKNNK